MARPYLIVFFAVAAIGMARAADTQTGRRGTRQTVGVPARYAGNWVCQTFRPFLLKGTS